MTELSDELLVAYVDGRLARKQSSAVEKVLEHDDVLAKRVKALKDAHDRLEAAFDAILAGEELEMGGREPKRAGVFVPWSVAKTALAGIGLACAFALMVLGYGWPLSLADFAQTSFGAGDPDYTGSIEPSWQETAARAQGLLARESLDVGLESQSNLDLVALQLGQAIGPSLKIPQLDAQGYRFKRGQLLRAGDQPLAELLYLGTSGGPLALFAKKGGDGEAPVFRRYGGVGSVAWSEDGISYLLAGEGDEPALMTLAEAIRSLPQPGAQKEVRGGATP